MVIFGRIQKRILLNIKVVDCYKSINKKSNKQTGQVCASRISLKPCKPQGKTAGSQGGFDKRMLSQKRWGRSARLKTPVGKKCPLKTAALAVDEKKQRQSKVARVELRAGGGRHGPQKPRSSVAGMAK